MMGQTYLCWLILCQILYSSPFHGVLVSGLVSGGRYDEQGDAWILRVAVGRRRAHSGGMTDE